MKTPVFITSTIFCVASISVTLPAFAAAANEDSPPLLASSANTNSSNISDSALFEYAQEQATEYASVLKKMFTVFLAVKKAQADLWTALENLLATEANPDAIGEAFSDVLNAMTDVNKAEMYEAAEELKEDGAGSILLVFSAGIEVNGLATSQDYGLAININTLLFPYKDNPDLIINDPLVTAFKADGLSGSFSFTDSSGSIEGDIDFMIGYHVSDPSSVGGNGIDVGINFLGIDLAFGFDPSTVTLTDPLPDLVAVFTLAVGLSDIALEGSAGVSHTNLFAQFCGMDYTLLLDDEAGLGLLSPFPDFQDGGGLDQPCPTAAQSAFNYAWSYQLNPVAQYGGVCADYGLTVTKTCASGLWCNENLQIPRCDNREPTARYSICDTPDTIVNEENMGSTDCWANGGYCNLNSSIHLQFPVSEEERQEGKLTVGQCNRKPDFGWLAMCTDHNDCSEGMACSNGACRNLSGRCQGNYYCASLNCIKASASDKYGQCSSCTVDKASVILDRKKHVYIINDDSDSNSDHFEITESCGGYPAIIYDDTEPGAIPTEHVVRELIADHSKQNDWFWVLGAFDDMKANNQIRYTSTGCQYRVDSSLLGA